MKNLEFLIKIYWNKSIGLKSIGLKSIFIFLEILKYKYKKYKNIKKYFYTISISEFLSIPSETQTLICLTSNIKKQLYLTFFLFFFFLLFY